MNKAVEKQNVEGDLSQFEQWFDQRFDERMAQKQAEHTRQ